MVSRTLKLAGVFGTLILTLLIASSATAESLYQDAIRGSGRTYGIHGEGVFRGVYGEATGGTVCELVLPPTPSMAEFFDEQDEEETIGEIICEEEITPAEEAELEGDIGFYGVYGKAAGVGGVGVYGKATDTLGPVNYGGYFEASGREGRGVAGLVTGAQGIGVYGKSANYYGGFFASDRDDLDLALGGRIGRISTDPNDEHSSLILSSNSDVQVRLDNDGGEEGSFHIASSAGQIFSVDETGRTTTRVLEITGGSDLSERFEIHRTELDQTPRVGMVVAIAPEHPGLLRLADHAYDRAVAGCISGANGISPGLTLRQEATVADGSYPVALSGRVYCWADAAHGPILPGDLLTTSDTSGHVMRVADYERAQGAILGKAMTALREGQGLVLVLVTLQ